MRFIQRVLICMLLLRQIIIIMSDVYRLLPPRRFVCFPFPFDQELSLGQSGKICWQPKPRALVLDTRGWMRCLQI